MIQCVAPYNRYQLFYILNDLTMNLQIMNDCRNQPLNYRLWEPTLVDATRHQLSQELNDFHCQLDFKYDVELSMKSTGRLRLTSKFNSY